jgi:hypothetical protein
MRDLLNPDSLAHLVHMMQQPRLLNPKSREWLRYAQVFSKGELTTSADLQEVFHCRLAKARLCCLQCWKKCWPMYTLLLLMAGAATSTPLGEHVCRVHCFRDQQIWNVGPSMVSSNQQATSAFKVHPCLFFNRASVCAGFLTCSFWTFSQ